MRGGMSGALKGAGHGRRMMPNLWRAVIAAGVITIVAALAAA